MRLGHNQRLEEITVNADINDSKYRMYEERERSESEGREAGCVAQRLAQTRQPAFRSKVGGWPSSFCAPGNHLRFLPIVHRHQSQRVICIGFRSRPRFRHRFTANLGPRNTSPVCRRDEFLVWPACPSKSSGALICATLLKRALA